MAPFQQFQYQALSSVRSTRLITLFPADQPDSDICIELSECVLESTLEYAALSYTWGDQQPTIEITCNGKILRVTENVHMALRRLRSNNGEQRTLWIDALSINQQDEAEKTAQVSEMGLIYSRAQRVNVWLGHPPPAMGMFFEFVRVEIEGSACEPEIADGTVYSFHSYSFNLNWIVNKAPRICTLTISLAAHISEYRAALHQFCSAPYWTRIWTIQEVVLNSNCWVYLGDAEPIRMSDLQESLLRIETVIGERWPNLGGNRRRAQDPGVLYPACGSPIDVMSFHQPGMVRSLDPDPEELRLLMTKKAKNPHDLFFACRALFPDTFGRIVVDYRRDLSDIITELTAHIIQRATDVGSLLSLICLCPPVPRAPSWAINMQWDGLRKHTSHYLGSYWTLPQMNSPRRTESFQTERLYR
ncbi:hypothetical protein PG984_013267 [Apiospora sp. TS-2023a]